MGIHVRTEIYLISSFSHSSQYCSRNPRVGFWWLVVPLRRTSGCLPYFRARRRVWRAGNFLAVGKTGVYKRRPSGNLRSNKVAKPWRVPKTRFLRYTWLAFAHLAPCKITRELSSENCGTVARGMQLLAAHSRIILRQSLPVFFTVPPRPAVSLFTRALRLGQMRLIPHAKPRISMSWIFSRPQAEDHYGPTHPTVPSRRRDLHAISPEITCFRSTCKINQRSFVHFYNSLPSKYAFARERKIQFRSARVLSWETNLLRIPARIGETINDELCHKNIIFISHRHPEPPRDTHHFWKWWRYGKFI